MWIKMRNIDTEEFPRLATAYATRVGRAKINGNNGQSSDRLLFIVVIAIASLRCSTLRTGHV